MSRFEHMAIEEVIARGESLTVEFKSDAKAISDRDLVATVVALANSDGGVLLIGIEDDGRVSGLHPNHANLTTLPALIASRTNPPLSVRAERIQVEGQIIARIDVPKARQLVSTSEGVLLRRRLTVNGRPEAVPFYPHEFIQRQSSLGLVDPSAMTIDAMDAQDLDPLQRARIRNDVKKYGGDQALLSLADHELDGALGLCREIGAKRIPTVAGLLLHGLTISNPGGFVEGVTLDNLLVVDPRSRNPLLADVIKRIGLAERTGRGIDRIYEGMLRYGRPVPDYSISDAHTVTVRMSNAAADFEFLKMVIAHEERTGDMPIDTLIMLSRLREERRLTTMDFAVAVQKSESVARSAVEKLVESGLVEPHGTGRGRTYTLSAKVYRTAGKKSEYVRQAGFAPIQQQQMVLTYIEKHGSIKRADVMDLCHLDRNQAYRLLARMKEAGKIKQIGAQKGAVYEKS